VQDLKKTTELKSTSEFRYLGLTDYQQTYELQLSLHQNIQENSTSAFILGLEHRAVLTLGYRAVEQNEISQDLVSLPIVRTGRGGLATIHSEGQLVIYPLLNLKEHGCGVRDFVHLLLQTTQECLLQFGVESFMDDRQVGLYTAKGKIAFCGLQIKTGISLHGLSLNVSNDLSLFSQIIACGVKSQQMDSINLNNQSTTPEVVFQVWSDLFQRKISKIS
jgi:lipoyl(octanoyl) transferase